MPYEFTPSRVGAQAAVDALTGRTTLSGRTTYLALLTALPTSTTTLSTMTELSDAGYTRESVTWVAPTNADPPVSVNLGAIDFGPFVGNPPNVVAVALVSVGAGTSGDFLGWWDTGAGIDSEPGNVVRIGDGALTLNAN